MENIDESDTIAMVKILISVDNSAHLLSSLSKSPEFFGF
jgi:hypothetical protein